MSNENKELPLSLLLERCTYVVHEAHSLASRYYSITSNVLLRHLLDSFVKGTDLPDYWPDFSLENAISAYNSASLFADAIDSYWPDSDDTHILELREHADTVMCATMAYIDKVGKQGLQLRVFTCSKCGHEVQLYTYYDKEDDCATPSGLIIPKNYGKDAVNTTRVYEFMHESHLCDGCWQYFVCEGE